MRTQTNKSLICGIQIQIDRSGIGHDWRNIDARNIPAMVHEEIEGEIIDGGKENTEIFIASNGQNYRWASR